jgi:zinc/manganese transport system substrate-binding protein
MVSPVAAAKVEVFTCEPEWAALADEIGGDNVNTFSATTARQDPHFLQARPSLIARVRRADLVICTGANLEIGWLPTLLRQASNPKTMPGNDGFLEASQYVSMRDIQASADRSAGDIHPYGNPHIQTDPNNLLPVAEALAKRLAVLDPGNAATYETRHNIFVGKWTEALQRWSSMAVPLKGMKVIVHHAAWVYMNDWLGLEEVTQMEPKPGIPPTVSHLSRLLKVVEDNDIKLFIRTAYQADRAAEWLSERTAVPHAVIPHTIGATDEASDLISLYEDMITRLLRVAQ